MSISIVLNELGINKNNASVSNIFKGHNDAYTIVPPISASRRYGSSTTMQGL